VIPLERKTFEHNRPAARPAGRSWRLGEGKKDRLYASSQVVQKPGVSPLFIEKKTRTFRKRGRKGSKTRFLCMLASISLEVNQYKGQRGELLPVELSGKVESHKRVGFISGKKEIITYSSQIAR